MKPILFRYLFIMLSALLTTHSYGQAVFDNLAINDEQDGLSHTSVAAIYKSSDGYLWIGTIEGLNRYNGRSFETYSERGLPSRSLSDNDVRAITEDREGNIWVGTANGLNKLDPRTETFKKYSFFEDTEASKGYSSIYSLAADKDILWVGTSVGLLRFNMRTENYTELDLGEQYKKSLILKDILDLKNQGKFLWIATKQGLFRYNKNSDKVENIHQSNLLNDKIEGDRVNHIRIDLLSDVWLATDKGITRLRPEGITYDVENFFVQPADVGQPPVRDFYYTAQVNDSLVFTGTIVSGLFTFNLKNKEFKKFTPESIDNVKTKCHYYDQKNQILWIGAINLGLIKVSPGQKLFTPKVFYDRTDRISSFFYFVEDKDNPDVIWAGTTTGLLRYNRRTEVFSTYYISFSNDIAYTIRSLADNGKGKIYVGTHNKGLYVFDKASGSFSKHIFSRENPEYRLLHSLFYKNKKLYIGASNMLFVYDEETQTLERHKINSDPEVSLQAMHVLSDKKILLGSYNGKTSLFDTQTHKVKKIHSEDGKCGISVIHFLDYDENRVLLGTYGNDLCVYDKNKQSIYQDPQLLTGYSAIYGVLEADNGDLWASSNYGLLFYDKTDENWITFKKSDGLQSNEFNVGALSEASDGELFFGGNNGFNHFYPKDIRFTKKQIPVYIEELQIFNKKVHPGDTVKGKVVLDKALRYKDSLQLSYRHNFLSIRYTGIDYIGTDQLQYRYKLEGFNESWVYGEQKNNTAVFTNLSSGKYTFKAQVKSKFSDFEDNQTQLFIVVKPPFWQTSLFYFLLVLFLVLSVIGFIKLRERNLRIEKKKLEQLVDLRTVEIRQARNDFELEKEFADAIIEISPEGIAVFDSYGSFLRVNPALCRILNFSASELMGSNIRQMVPGEWGKQITKDFERVNRGETVVLETEMLRKDDSPIDVRFSAARIAESAVVAVITDISKRKIAEYKAEQYRAELEKQVRERTADYKRAKEKAETADQLKTAFLANMSHEIRTPLNSILGFAQLLDDDDISREQIKDYTELIQRGGNSLLHLINDIIDLARIESNQLVIEKEDFSVNELIDESYRMFLKAKENLQDGTTELRINLPEHDVILYSDRNRIKQVLINLLNNAHKFTEEGYIEVGYEQIISEGKVYLQFYVEDTGAGISDDKLGKVFSRFTKFDKKSTRVLKGAGLGLAISRRIVELLGGQIKVKSEIKKGSVFYFTIPL